MCDYRYLVVPLLMSTSAALGQNDGPAVGAAAVSPRALREAPRVTVGRSGTAISTSSAAGPPAEKLAYANDHGLRQFDPGGGRRLADDLVLTVRDGAELARYEFWVSGIVDPASEHTGPYTIEFGLYDSCPEGGGSLIPGSGTILQVTDPGQIAGIIRVEFIPDPGVHLPQSPWFTFEASRRNVGILGGLPALHGFSDDRFALPGFDCFAWFGSPGFPVQPHSSVNLNLFVTEAASDSYVTYRRTLEHDYALGTSGSPSYLLADDFSLLGQDCELVGYEIGVRGTGTFQVDLRGSVGTLPASSSLPGTGATVVNITEDFFLARTTIDPPVPIHDSKIWMTLSADNPTAGWVVPWLDSTVGSTEPSYARSFDGGATWATVLGLPDDPERHVGFHAALYCAGQPPIGACCDMFRLDNGGDSVCRELPEVNCPTPPFEDGTPFRPGWVEGAACADDPFPFTCGLAACCTPQDTCENLTDSQCAAVEPIDDPGRRWSPGRFCDDFTCPWSACIAGEGLCSLAREGEPGCGFESCCQQVCAEDPYCCQVEWDEACAIRAASSYTCVSDASYDICELLGSNWEGALQLELGRATALHLGESTRTLREEPGFCCNEGPARTCESGGSDAGTLCFSDEDCEIACSPADPAPGEQVRGQSWTRLRIPEKTSPDEPDVVSLQVDTCFANAELADGVVQLYEAKAPVRTVCRDVSMCADGTPCIIGNLCSSDNSQCQGQQVGCDPDAPECPFDRECVIDPTEACENLQFVSCSDNAGFDICPDTPLQAHICADGLRRGVDYFAMVGYRVAPTGPDRGTIRIRATVVDQCPAHDAPSNDNCDAAEDIWLEQIPYSLESATFECPSPTAWGCGARTARYDVWYRFHAPEDGNLTLSTCPDEGNPVPDLAVYEGCTCPTVDATRSSRDGLFPSREPIRCDGNDYSSCPHARGFSDLHVVEGQCYLIRLSSRYEPVGRGTLTIRRAGDDCDDDAIPNVCEQDCGSPGGLCDVPGCGLQADCNANTVDDDCELFDGSAFDCQPNGQLDSCDIELELSEDCDQDGVPDECLIAISPLSDCDENGRLDSCELAEGVHEDCDANSIPDVCDLAADPSRDCNDNDVYDPCELDDPSLDCNSNLLFDTCEIEADPASDCNLNGRLDSCEIAALEVDDCDQDGVPDACQLKASPGSDCNANARLDTCEIDLDGAPDCNENRIPDFCEIASSDCDSNGLVDECQIAADASADCDNSGVVDSCEVQSGARFDCNENGILDNCTEDAVIRVFEDTFGSPLDLTVWSTVGSVFVFNGQAEIDLQEQLISPAIDLDGLVDVRLQLDYSEEADAGDTMSLDFWDGSAWSTIETFDGGPADNVLYELEFMLPAHVLRDGFQFRFVANTNASFDDFEIQRVAVVTPADLNGDGVVDSCARRGDFNGDGIVSPVERAKSIECLTGPSASALQGCEVVDVDFSSTVDLRDLAIIWGASNAGR